MATNTVHKTGTTKNPAGLVIERNGMEFTLSWKVMDKDYSDGLQVQWRTNYSNPGVWLDIDVTTSDTSGTGSVIPGTKYPFTSKIFNEITMRVRGKRSDTSETSTSGDTTTNTITSYSWSGWSTKSYKVSVPRQPSAAEELVDTYPTCRFSWQTISAYNDEYPATNVEWQSMLINECTEVNGEKLTWNSSKLGWMTGTDDLNGEKIISEDSTTLANGSYTRWLRVRSRGPAGASAWRYIKHVYAVPYTATINSNAKYTYARMSGASTTDVRVEWTSNSNAAHPIDYTEVQYVIGTPSAASLAPPTNGWATGATITDSAGTDIVQFVIDDQVATDECLWVRVANYHDVETNPAISNTLILMTGKLAAPAISGTVATDSDQRSATITFSNNSSVPDSRIAVVFYRGKNAGYICGVSNHGDTSITVTNLLPWSSSTAVSFGLFAFRGTYTYSNGWKEGFQYTTYMITEARPMTSDTVTQGGNVPIAPTGVSATQADGSAEALVRWNWNWNEATQAEVSWSTNRNAWQSTTGPSVYVVNAVNAPEIRVTGLTVGVTWYFRVRFLGTTDASTVYGPYSNIMSVTVGSAPLKPSLALSGTVAQKTTWVTASWEFLSTDGTNQSSAVLWECSANGESIKQVGMASWQQYCSFRPDKQQWGTGSIHYLKVRVTSASGLISEWSDPVAITIADPVTCTITQASLGPEFAIPYIYPSADIYPDDDLYPSNGRNGQYKLSDMPLTVTVTGAGAGGITTVAVERLMDYSIERPDGSHTSGYAGETIALFSQVGEAQITIDNDDLIGTFDDGAWYQLVATVQDGIGQTATESRRFIVDWEHQAIIPSASATMTGTVAIISAEEPEEAEEGDYIDIYRLSADKPELIYTNAQFGEQYVDPYPALGKHGGHRVVYRTSNGDYITGDNHVAWTDLGEENGDLLDIKDAIIDFAGDQIVLEYNIDLSSNWSKDFQETKYLGGAVQGDWNPGVSRTGTISGVAYSINDLDKISAMRRLAAHPGICHVRTPDGSSFSADVQVSESQSYSSGGKAANFTLNITRVDPEELDGVSYAQWIGG